jgi:UTP--glucose-1-phosphate uridylyltransferase
MKVRKAVVTAAGPGQRQLPLQKFVDRDGVEMTALQILAEEILSTGVESIGVVVAPGDQGSYSRAAGPFADRLSFVEQPRPRGYGHALGLAQSFTGGEAFLQLVGDHLYLSRGGP